MISRAEVLGYENGYPIVPVTVLRHPKINRLKIAACPYCGKPHHHGGGLPDKDPRDFQGHRVLHCVQRVPHDKGYILKIVGGDGR